MDVSWLGFGAARISTETGSPAQAETLLNALLDCGVNYIDTAECYGDSEETLGKYISHRRDEYWLTTKCGHVAGDMTASEWTADAVTQGIDQSLRRLQTDYLDLVHIHTCTIEVLRQGDVVQALQEAQQAGKTRHIGFSGDNKLALEAIGMGIFATLITSFNVLDQNGLNEVLPAAEAAGMGIIAKRPIANAAFNRAASPYDYADAYWERARHFTVPEGAPEDGAALALRFCRSFDYIDTAIVGIDSTDQLEANIKTLEDGPLPTAVLASLQSQFQEHGQDWPQLV
jgi:hypothetical protein